MQLHSTAHQTLLAHLALRFAVSPENVATEALAYILQRSAAAGQALTTYLAQWEPTIPPDLVYQQQLVLDPSAGRPDLVGLARGVPRLVMESKFWAGLTDQQPVGYLRTLYAPGSLLVILAPRLRFDTLWPELLRLCLREGLDIQDEGVADSDVRLARIGGEQTLVLVSWRTLLARLHSAMAGAEERQLMADLEQLQGLCERMDERAFLPLREEELFSATPQRLPQYASLVDSVVLEAKARGLCSIQGLRVTPQSTGHGRYARLPHSRALCFVAVDVEKWSDLRQTPLWMTVYQQQEISFGTLRARLQPLVSRIPSRIIIDDAAQQVYVAFELPVGVERDAVVESLLEQFKVVCELVEHPGIESVGMMQ